MANVLGCFRFITMGDCVVDDDDDDDSVTGSCDGGSGNDVGATGDSPFRFDTFGFGDFGTRSGGITA